ncbi:glycosyltransferase family 9 protein [Mucilaginibacter sp. UR6-1]|uniref:glycosyltransferase family 9 protein n=1 Tax=Mucilaginibacter sp. UR6-1 TaxID=1435643 RepID=UPI001E2DCDEC|nr:glycosyltransferase family 9 protein [Mucilaginibacter sp. UR6-1]MCC8408158.1 glycosyltransferase family 9 protein [Mucilaginibacter sp. UR6-1]
MAASGKRVLIYRLGSLGDTIMALPCFHKIKESFADADITLLTNKPVMAKAAAAETVLGSGYFFNRIINYPVGTRSPRILFELILQIRLLKIDTVVNINPARSRMSLLRDYWFFKAAGVKKMIGFDAGKEDFEVCVDEATGINEWEAKRLARRISILGELPLDDDRYWDLKLNKKEIYTANCFNEALPSGIPVLAISLGTKNPANEWGMDNWQLLLQQLSARLNGWMLMVIGAADEKQTGDKCLEVWGKEGVNFCGQTSPRVSAALLKNATVFIGHDSGPIHLAACVGTPAIGIYSARNMPGQWFPRGNNNRIIYRLPECAGCGLEVCVEQRKKCILSITVHEVKQALFDIVTKTNEEEKMSPLITQFQ